MPGPRITVIFPIYNAEKTVALLVEQIIRQKHPLIAAQSDWLEVLFIDNCSSDTTLAVLASELKRAGMQESYRVVANETNLGISGSFNKAFQLAQAPFVLTCHCDCFFETDGYVAEMLRLLESTPKAAAITGMPIVPADLGSLPFAEKVNLIANLQDIFPPEASDELVPVGFAESRCDGFRIEALRKVGFYDRRLKFAGEDQVMAARLRDAGYEVYQAPRLRYRLSVSVEQNSLRKLATHQRLFGRAHPYIVLKTPGVQSGILGRQAGKNRRLRTLLRATQLISFGLYFLILFGLLAHAPLQWVLFLVGFLVAMKAWIFWTHIRRLALGPMELLVFSGFQPFLDVSYTLGLFQGLWLIRNESGTIH